MRPTAWLLGVLALTVLVYLPGLNGPFLFDDVPNLTPLADWLGGRTGWQEVFLGNRSGLLGRPISMLTFVINGMLFGMGPFSFKLTNLAIHLACGGLIYALLSRLLARDPQLRQRAGMVALLISAIWLLHPMQVSTVLYIVQRMAQLSTFFMLLALLAYLFGRLALEQKRQRAGMVWLFIVLPVATIAATLSKENGALTSLLCAVLELGYFRANALTPRPRSVNLFFALTLGLPLLVATSWLLLHPGWLAASYSGRMFTLGERLLSEPRVLFDYMGALLLPRGPSLGLYNDDFPISHGLWQPPATLLALLGLLALIGVAITTRRRAPTVFTGIAFYLAGHAMESSVLPLELYFEHRNYLPSVGFFLAVVGALTWLASRLPTATADVSRKRLFATGVIAVCVALSMATAARAWVWQSWSTIAEQGARQHPDSARAQFDYASVLWQAGELEQTQRIYDRLSSSENPISRHLAVVYTLKMQCEQHSAVNPQSRDNMAAIAGSMLQLAEMEAFDRLGEFLVDHDCTGLSKTDLANILSKIADATPQPQSHTQVWRTRFRAARLYMNDGQYRAAETQAALAWANGNTDTSVGVVLANLYYLNGDLPSARLILSDVYKRMAPWDVRNQKLAAKLQDLFDKQPQATAPQA